MAGRQDRSEVTGEERVQVPPGLAGAAAWCWRILVVAAAFYLLARLLNFLGLAFLPVAAALLLAALLHPLVGFLRHHGWPRPLATWGTLVVAFLLLGGIVYFVVQQVTGSIGTLVDQVDDITTRLRALLDRIPGTTGFQLADLQDRLVDALRNNTSMVASQVLQVGTLLAEVLTGAILTFFLTFFFLDEGDRLYSWVVRLFPRSAQPSIRGAGVRAWHVLSGWIVGTAIIAVFHGVVIGLVLWFLGVPLAVPLGVLVFLGSFIPIVGAVVFGGLAVLVTLLSQGLFAGIVVLVVLVVENQIEAHLLQPFIVGRAVRIHPVAIVLALTVGGVVSGVFGAILAIPVVAAAHGAVKFLTGVEDVEGRPRRGNQGRMDPSPPPDYAPLGAYAPDRRADVASPAGHVPEDSQLDADGDGHGAHAVAAEEDAPGPRD